MVKNYKNNRQFIRKLILRVLPAQAISILVANLSGVIDGYLIGNNLESTALTAYGIISPFTMLLNAIATIFSAGALIVCGKEMGKEKNDNPNKIFSLALVIAFGLGLLVMIVGLIIPTPIVKLLGAEGEVISLAKDYLCGILIGMPLLMIMPILLSFLQYGNDNHILVISASISAVLKLVLDLLFIKGDRNAIFGVGVSTAISNFAAILFLSIRYITNKKLVKFSFKYVDFSFLKSIILFGLPSAVINIMFAIRNIFLNNVAQSAGGNIAVDSISICSTLGLICVINSAMATTVAMIGSIFTAKEDRESLNSLLFVSFHFNVIWNLIQGILICIFSKEVSLFFGSSNIEITSHAVFYYIISLITFALPTNTINLYKCMGRINLVNIILTLQCFGYQLLGIYILPIFFGLEGLWYNYIVADILTIITFVIIIWIKNKKITISFYDSFCFDENFGSKDQFIYMLNKNNQDEFYQLLSEYVEKLKLDANIYQEILNHIYEYIINEPHEVNIYVKDDVVNLRIRNFDKNFVIRPNLNYTEAFKMNEVLYRM